MGFTQALEFWSLLAFPLSASRQPGLRGAPLPCIIIRWGWAHALSDEVQVSVPDPEPFSVRVGACVAPKEKAEYRSRPPHIWVAPTEPSPGGPSDHPAALRQIDSGRWLPVLLAHEDRPQGSAREDAVGEAQGRNARNNRLAGARTNSQEPAGTGIDRKFLRPEPMSESDRFRYRRDPLVMNVSLTPDLEELVQKKVQSGRYTSASEVVREALRLLAERDELREVELQALRARVEQGLDEARRGELVDGEEAFREVRSRRPARRPRTK